MAQRQQPPTAVDSTKPTEPMFTLRAQDRTAPATIRDWALRAARAGSPAEKIGTALITSVLMEEWQQRHGSKIPD